MMDRALKERIIGAVILVLFVVLVVPVFIDGPSDSNEIISERVPLPGQSEQKAQTVILDRDRKDPVPAAASNGSVEPEPKPTPQVVAKQQESATPPLRQEPTPAPEKPKADTTKAVVTSSPPVASSTGMWAAQLGSFGNEKNAEKLAADLRKQGFAAFLSKLATNSGQLHRVRIGPQKDRESAEAMAERLAKAGHKGQVVPHP